MTEEMFVSLEEFCAGHNIELSFIIRLEQYGLIQTTIRQRSTFIQLSELPALEKIVRLHYELDINLEGLCVQCLLLQVVDEVSRADL